MNKETTNWVPSHVQLVVHQARDLLLKSKNANSEVFASLQVEGEKSCTSLVSRTTAPQWHQKFDIPLMSLDTTIHISVRQKSRFAEEHIGHIAIPLATFSITSKSITHWYKLGARPGKVNKKLRGDILISITFLSKWTTPEVELSNSYTEFEGSRVATGCTAMLKRSKSDIKLKQNNSNGSADKQANSRVKEKISAFRRSFRKKRGSQMYEEGNDDFTTFSLTPPDSLSPTTTPDLKRWSQTVDARPKNRSYSLSHSNGKSRSQSDGAYSELSLSPPVKPSVQALFAEAAALENGTRLGGPGELEEGSEEDTVSDSKPTTPALKFHQFKRKQRSRTLQALPLIPTTRDTESTDSSKPSLSTESSKPEQVSSTEDCTEQSVTYRARSTKIERSPRPWRARSYSMSDSRSHSLALESGSESNTPQYAGSPIMKNKAEHDSSTAEQSTESGYNTLSSQTQGGQSSPSDESSNEGKTEPQAEASSGVKPAKPVVATTSTTATAPVKRVTSPLSSSTHHSKGGLQPKLLNYSSANGSPKALGPKTAPATPQRSKVTSSASTRPTSTGSKSSSQVHSTTASMRSRDALKSRPESNPATSRSSSGRVQRSMSLRETSKSTRNTKRSTGRPGDKTTSSASKASKSSGTATPTVAESPAEEEPSLQCTGPAETKSSPSKGVSRNKSDSVIQTSKPKNPHLTVVKSESSPPSSRKTKHTVAYKEASSAALQPVSLLPPSLSELQSRTLPLHRKVPRPLADTGRSLSATLNRDSDSEPAQPKEQVTIQQPNPPVDTSITDTSDASTAVITATTDTIINSITATSDIVVNTSSPASSVAPGSLSPTLPRRAITPEVLQSRTLSPEAIPATASFFSTLPRSTHKTPENIRVLHRRSWNFAVPQPSGATVTVPSSDGLSPSPAPNTTSGRSSPVKLTDVEITDSEERPDTAMSICSVASSTRSTTPTTPSPLSVATFSAASTTNGTIISGGATLTAHKDTATGRDRLPPFLANRRSSSGLRKALSMYQENKRQSVQARQSRLRTTPERRVSEESPSDRLMAVRTEEASQVTVSADNSPSLQRKWSATEALSDLWGKRKPFSSLRRTKSHYIASTSSSSKPGAATAFSQPSSPPPTITTTPPSAETTTKGLEPASSESELCLGNGRSIDDTSSIDTKQSFEDTDSGSVSTLLRAHRESTPTGSIKTLTETEPFQPGQQPCATVESPNHPLPPLPSSSLEGAGSHSRHRRQRTCGSVEESEGIGSLTSEELTLETLAHQDWGQWSKEDLVKELIHSKQRLQSTERELTEVKSYLDNLLLRIMESNPAILSSQ